MLLDIAFSTHDQVLSIPSVCWEFRYMLSVGTHWLRVAASCMHIPAGTSVWVVMPEPCTANTGSSSTPPCGESISGAVPRRPRRGVSARGHHLRRRQVDNGRGADNHWTVSATARAPSAAWRTTAMSGSTIHRLESVWTTRQVRKPWVECQSSAGRR